MRDIKNLKGSSLRWLRLGWIKSSYELMDDEGETYATLDWKGVFSEKALLSTAYGDYELRWRGLIRRHVPIVDTASGQEVGRLNLGIRDSGTFLIESGTRFRFKCTSMWRSRFAVLDDVGDTVATLGFTGWLSIGRTGGKVWLGPAAIRGRELLVLIAVGWYAAVVISRESAAAAAAGG